MVMLMNKLCQMVVKFLQSHTSLHLFFGDGAQSPLGGSDILGLRIVNLMIFNIFWSIFFCHFVFYFLPQRYNKNDRLSRG